MEKSNFISSNIKERISNPLIFSFIFSWLVINWQITIGLLLFNSQQIEKAGYHSIFDLITCKINTTDSFNHPLYFAIGYILLIPIVKNLITAFNSWASKWGEDWNLKILKEGKISINKYFSLRENYDKRNKILEEVISKDSEYIKNYDSVRNELLQTQSNLNSTAQRLNISDTYVRQSKDISILNGAWESQYEMSGEKGIEDIVIENGYYYIISPIGERKHLFDIRNFFYDNRNETVFFIKELTAAEKPNRPKEDYVSRNNLKFETKDMLAGIENDSTKIAYRRK